MVVSTPTGPARARGTALRAHGPTATLRAGPRALRAQTFTGLRPHGPATGPDLYGPTASRARNGPKLLRAHGLTAHSGPEPLRPTASRPRPRGPRPAILDLYGPLPRGHGLAVHGFISRPMAHAANPRATPQRWATCCFSPWPNPQADPCTMVRNTLHGLRLLATSKRRECYVLCMFSPSDACETR